MATFHDIIKAKAKEIQTQLKAIDSLSSLRIDIEITGRVHTNELKIEYKVGESYGSGGQVSGADLQACIQEFKRRHGWEERNAPLMLTFDEGLEVPEPDQIQAEPVPANDDETPPFEIKDKDNEPTNS